MKNNAQPNLLWSIPDWPAPANVQALCTTRQGGCSVVPFDSLNLGDHVGDDLKAVAANRCSLQDGIAACSPDSHLVFLQQVHGTQVVLLDAGNLPADRVLCADASIATTPGPVCTIMVADCLPVLLTNRQGSAVAAAHAGWRGLAGVSAAAAGAASDSAGKSMGVLESVLEHFWLAGQVQQAPVAINKEAAQTAQTSKATATAVISEGLAADTLAWLGPCIGPKAFEVGEDVRAAFCDHDAAAALHFQPAGDSDSSSSQGKYLADLAGLARQRLRAAGVTQIYGNDSTPPWCTVGNPSRFFSHRRDSASLGGSGRFAVCIWRI